MSIAVVPRALSPISGEALPLDALVQDAMAEASSGRIALVGPPGAGKATALRWVLGRLPGLREPGADDLLGRRPEGVRIYATAASIQGEHLAVLAMAPWGTDEAIEYLLARHPAVCASVMGRVDDAGFAEGLPGLWVPILEQLASDPSLPDVRAAALREAEALRFFRPVRRLLGALAFLRDLRAGAPDVLEGSHGLDLIGEIVRLATPEDLARLEASMHEDDVAMAASILLAAGIPPEIQPGCSLRHARLEEVDLAGRDLRLVDASHAWFDGASLQGANLSYVLARAASFRWADLRDVSFEHTRAPETTFAHARLDRLHAPRGEFPSASFRGASLRNAVLEGADLEHADLRGACLEEARLVRCELAGARLEGASLGGADLRHAHLAGVDLRRAHLSGADLSRVRAPGVRLAGVRLPGAYLVGALLVGADFTGASMPGAHLRGALLTFVRAGDVDWEGADLRDANLSGITFHMGSSRSGLVDSPIASEGSRTGYYTDEYHEMHFKAPEEIRKANLREADLRGANIEHADFYLVDLRDARYTPAQARVFERCGAILHGPELGR